MPDVAIQNGEVILRDGLVGLGLDCCCGSSGSDGSGPQDCNCSAGCEIELTLVCDGNPDGPIACIPPSPSTPDRPWALWQASGNRSNVFRNGCESSSNYATLECIEGQWIVTAVQGWCCDFLNDARSFYTAVVPCDQDGLPIAGDVELEFVETVINGEIWCDDAEPQNVPVVSITRP